MSKKFNFIVILIGLLFCFSVKDLKAASATLSLSPSYGTYTINNSFDINVNLNTGGGRTVGTDVILKYDQTKLKLNDIISGSLYTQYVGKEIDNTTGRATISGISTDVVDAYTGTGTLVTLKFQAIATGTAVVSFDFTAGGSRDSNVADFDTKADILTTATGGSYAIIEGSGGSGSSGSTTTTTTTTDTTSTTSMPESGISLPTMMLVLFGLLTFGSGAYLVKKNY